MQLDGCEDGRIEELELNAGPHGAAHHHVERRDAVNSEAVHLRLGAAAEEHVGRMSHLDPVGALLGSERQEDGTALRAEHLGLVPLGVVHHAAHILLVAAVVVLADERIDEEANGLLLCAEVLHLLVEAEPDVVDGGEGVGHIEVIVG